MLHRLRMMRLAGAVDPFAPIYCLGGGGGGSSNSGGNDALWNAQAEQVKQSSAMSGEMFDYWQKYSPQYLDNANTMTQEAMDGTLTNRARTTAGADADQATAAGLDAATRSLDRYGSTLNPNAVAHDAKSIALQGAANKAGAMSQATQWGENQKWARNQDAYGLTSGMPGNAVASANSAQSGLNGLASMQNSKNNIDAANASGYGQAGATMAYGLFKKDGGSVKANRHSRPGINRLAAGGVPKNPVVGWRQRVAAMPTIGKTSTGSNPIENTLSGAAPTIAGELAKPYLKEAGSAIKDSLANAVGQGRAGLERMAGVDQSQAAAEVVDKSSGLGMAGESGGVDAATAAADTGATEAATTAATDAAADAAATAAADTAATAAADTAATAAAETAAAAAAETAAASTAGTAVAANAWNPIGWIGAGLMAANALSRADGGDVPGLKRKDMTAGGPVSGPGTETSDSIPAWLSDDEYVLNAPAVRMVGKEKLDRINEAGLKKRHGEKAVMVDGEAKPNGLAGGGMLGIALGSGAQTYNQLQQQSEQTRVREEQLRLMQASDARAAEAHGLNVNRINEDNNTKKAINEGAVAGLTNTKDMRDSEKQFALTKGLYDSALKVGRPDLASSYYNQMSQARGVLLSDAFDRAERVRRSTGGNISGFVDAYNNYVADGQTIDAFSRNDDGSHTFTVNDGSGKVSEFTVPKEKTDEYIMALRDPKKIAEIEQKRAEILFKAEADAREKLNTPVAIGKDQTLVIPGTWQTFSPGGQRGFDPKESGSVLNDINKIFVSKYGKGDPNDPMAPKSLSDEGLAKSSLAQRVFMENRNLPPAMIAEIADKGAVGQATVEINGRPQKVQAINYNGRTFLLGGGDAGMQSSAPQGAAAQPQQRPVPTTNGAGTREMTGKIGMPQAPGINRLPEPSASMQVTPSDQAARDVRAGLMRVSELGGVERAMKELSDLDAALKNSRLDGTQRRILQTERNLLAAGIAAQP